MAVTSTAHFGYLLKRAQYTILAWVNKYKIQIVERSQISTTHAKRAETSQILA